MADSSDNQSPAGPIDVSTDFRTYLFKVFDHFWLTILLLFFFLYGIDGSSVSIGSLLFAVVLFSYIYYQRRVRNAKMMISEYRIIFNKNGKEKIYPLSKLKAIHRPRFSFVRNHVVDYMFLTFEDSPGLFLDSTLPQYKTVKSRISKRLKERNQYDELVKGLEL